MRFAVTGGRDYDNEAVVRRALEALPTDAVMVNGGARGADSLAYRVWVIDLRRQNAERYPADWNQYGRAAGPIRNKQMLDTGIDLLVAFPGGCGTEHMTGICWSAGVPVVQCG